MKYSHLLMRFLNMIISGKLSGDLECWCLEVTEDTYREIVGEEIYQLELHDRKQDRVRSDIWRLYPDDIFYALGVKQGDVTFKIELL